MSAPGPRTAQIIALWQSGELASAARGTRTRAEWAAKLGMTSSALDAAIAGAREHGHAVPTFGQLRISQSPLTVSADSVNDSFADEEPTHPIIGKPDIRPQSCQWGEQRPDFGHAAIGMHTATVPNLVIAPPNLGSAAQQPIAPGGETSIHVDFVPESSAPQPAPNRWPHVEAFDAVGGNDMLPAHGPGVRRSTLLRDGEPVLQWIKNPGGGDSQSVIDACMRAFGEMPRFDDSTQPADTDDELMAIYPIGDAHVGMLAWARETGENFDLRIAERNLLAAVTHLVKIAPNAERAAILNMGDFVHSDGPKPTTAKGTPVDVDGRWPKVIETAIRALRRMVDAALTKHEHVTVINARGNHDETSALVISIALAQFYENNPRVTVDQSAEFFHWIRFEQNLIGITHSHTARTPSALLGVMVVDRARDWGETRHRRYYCGHLHHHITKEEATLICEWVPTLAGLDAWHRGQGYRAVRELRCDVFHARRGMIHRLVVGLDHVHELVAEAA